MATRIPPLLDPYLGPPPETSLVLLSGVLGSTTNWLVLRYLYSLLSASSDSVAKDDLDSPNKDDTSVVLISFLRDSAFWRDGAGKLGIDLDLMAKKGRFIFVDGLTGLFHAASRSHTPRPSPGNLSRTKVLATPTLQHLRKELQDAIAQIQHSVPEQKTILIVDQLDLFLATSEDEISSQGLRETLLDTREKVHSTIVTVSADEPLMAPQATFLEKEHAAFVTSLAHDAHLVLSLRMLDTGTARDVSGVLRVTQGGELDALDKLVEERELLYFVAGDGGVRVFERGQ
ncbi:hypothetical protein M426DRAFT_317980 [Hypoxylon sp. CI-4A]|nr:hypothetical protein M426DRAFT_317980 [Hypoxylon sp. CI-4A]